MPRFSLFWVVCVPLLFLCGIPGLAQTGSRSPTGGKPIPPFSEIQQTVLEYFQSRPDYKPNDLITREDVQPLSKLLQKRGVSSADMAPIIGQLPGRGEFFVDQLSTPNGRKFMRRISAYPNAYDRVDRLSRMIGGQQLLRDLIKGPGGEKLIEYLTTSSGGKETGKSFADAPRGAHFNEPTGRIYTVNALLAQIQKSYTAAEKVKSKK
jgi:hypothetical protein